LLEPLWILEGASVGSVDLGGGHRQVSRGSGHGEDGGAQGGSRGRGRAHEKAQRVL
jgi:hypothetical protein